MPERLWSLLAAVVSTLVSLVAAEAGLRLIDGESLTRLRLQGSVVNTEHVAKVGSIAGPYLRKLHLPSRMPADWFTENPEPRSFPAIEVDNALNERYWNHRGAETESIYEWNLRYLTEAICSKREPFVRFETIFAFEPREDNARPSYRYPAGVKLPTGLATNRFGWRGREIAEVPAHPRTIRIAFVGASTTVAAHYLPFSYPEHVDYWLNRWASANGFDVRFEVFNTGHEGMDSSDFAAIVRQDLPALRPDLIIYYEGSNQFWPDQFVRWESSSTPPRPKETFPPPSLAEQYSAIGRRLVTWLNGGSNGREPAKEFGSVEWPKDLNENDPKLDHPQLPLNLPTILKDMESIRRTAAAMGGELVVSSFIWLVFDDMNLSMPAHLNIYRYLNETFRPFPYRHIRRMVDFQNRVFASFARQHGLPFIDVASVMPTDPNLFDDAIHMNQEGIRLHAWIVANNLVSIIEERLQAGRLPKPFASARSWLAMPRLTVRRDAIAATCP